MIEFTGKNTHATVMLDEVEQDVISQLYEMLSSPMFTGQELRIMPDTHVGDKCLIGLTSKYNGYIHPSAIGVDIGCGMNAIQFDRDTLNFDSLDKDIRKHVPLGFNIHKDKEYTMELIGQYAQMQLKDFTKHQRNDLGLDYNPIDYSGNYLEKLCKKIDTNQDQLMSALGSLGGGNHFIEVDEDENNNKWLIVHSGSRNFGLKVANYHAKIAGKTITSCLSGDAAFEYIVDMLYAQAYASFNRMEILKEIVTPLEGTVKLNNIIESIHNFIHPRDLMIRKGAISSYTGQDMIIPFNMRDGTIICEGKSNPEWNFSAPHGAGRSMSRSQAKKTLSLEKFQKEMEGIYSTCVNVNTLDESPDSYKNKNIILENINPTATIKHVLRPIFNIKG
jgi:tRNA-splicing ligase RtcB